MTSDTTTSAADFIRRWEASGAAERANYQLFLSELCDLLGVERPQPSRPDDRDNIYVFERNVTFSHGDGSTSTGRIDLYKKGHFVCEAKQGSDRTEESPLAMVKAKGQAEQYARALPVGEGCPPFLIVVDVGYAIKIYSEFSCTGKTHLSIPDPVRIVYSWQTLNSPKSAKDCAWSGANRIRSTRPNTVPRLSAKLPIYRPFWLSL